MTDQPVRAAIVGLGRWGENLTTAPTSALRFTHATTRSTGKAQDFCRKQELTLLLSFDEVLACNQIEAVVLATPHSQHGEQIRHAAAARKHVFVEKPLALHLDDAQEATAAAQRAGIHLCVGFNRRFLPAFQRLEVGAGALGRLLHVEGAFSGSFGYQYTDQMWRGDTSENPAGGMAAMGIHILDLMIALLGPVRRVSTISRHVAVPSQLQDVTSVMLDFTCGATGSLSTLMSTANFWRLHVFGANGWAQMPDQTSLITATLDGHLHREDFAPCDSLAAELDAFAHQIRTGQPYPVSLRQALDGVAAMEAIAISAENGGRWTDVVTASSR